jgi:hypothetical protein
MFDVHFFSSFRIPTSAFHPSPSPAPSSRFSPPPASGIWLFPPSPVLPIPFLFRIPHSAFHLPYLPIPQSCFSLPSHLLIFSTSVFPPSTLPVFLSPHLPLRHHAMLQALCALLQHSAVQNPHSAFLIPSSPPHPLPPSPPLRCSLPLSHSSISLCAVPYTLRTPSGQEAAL